MKKSRIAGILTGMFLMSLMYFELPGGFEEVIFKSLVVFGFVIFAFSIGGWLLDLIEEY